MTTSVNRVDFEPRHKLFLSHSGAEKEFVEQLCVDLERNLYNPFFDKRDDSLEKGVAFPDTIFRVIEGCWVAVLVLSEGFLSRSKWPMLELAAIAEAYAGCNKKLKILPLYLKLSCADFRSRENRERWCKTWRQWAAEGSRGVDVAKWTAALKLVDKMNGMQIEAGTTEVAFRKLVVETICKICPNIVFDDSHVVGRERFCQRVSNVFDNLKCADKRGGHSMIGVFGMGGMGKTTLCKIMCNHYFGRFEGKVFHVNLGIRSFLEQKLKIIKKTGGSEGMLEVITDPAEGCQQLKRCLSQNRLFLALDGVSDDHEVMEEVRWYVSQTYGEGSMIMVTSRSCEVLSTVLQAAGLQENEISERVERVIKVPKLNEMEAIQLFLQEGSNKHLKFVSFTEDEQSRVLEAVQKGHFQNSRLEEHFHPLALKALGAHLCSLIGDPPQWLKTIQNLDLTYSRTNIFSVLRTAYDALPVEEKLIFMDVAIYKPGCINTMGDICQWLSIVHEMDIRRIEDHLQSLRKKSLFEEGSLDYGLCLSRRTMTEPPTALLEHVNFSYGDSEVVVHDLYLEFAKMEAHRGPLSESSCFTNDGAEIVPIQMLHVPVGGCWPVQRLSLVRGGFQNFDGCNLGEWFCNLRVLKLEYLSKLKKLNVGRLSRLLNLDIFYCEQLQAIEGIGALDRLGWLRVARCEKLESFPRLDGMTRLKHVELRGSVIASTPEIVDCSHLSELRLSGHLKIQTLQGLVSLDALQKMVIEWCPQLEKLPSLQNFRMLLELHISDCLNLGGEVDVSNLQFLQKLHLRAVRVRKLVCDGELRNLRELVCENCSSLVELPSLQDSRMLLELNLSDCLELHKKLYVSNLLLLQKLHLKRVGICELDGLGKLWNLRELVCKNCRDLVELPDISALEKLEVLDVEFKRGILRSTRASRKSAPLTLHRDVQNSKLYVKFRFDRLAPLQHMRRILVHYTGDIGFVNAAMEVMMQDASSSKKGVPCSVMLLQGGPSAGSDARQNCFGAFTKHGKVSCLGITFRPASADYDSGASQIMLCFIYSNNLEKSLRQAIRKCWQVKTLCYKSTEEMIKYLDQEKVIKQSYSLIGLHLGRLGTRALGATGLDNLVTLLVEDCNVERLDALGNLKKLVRLVVKGCKHLCDRFKLEGMNSLEYLECSDCDHYHEARLGMWVVDCPKLSEIFISSCRYLRYLFTCSEGTGLTPFTGLKKMEIRSCRSLVELTQFRIRIPNPFPVLEVLKCQDCGSLENLPTFGHLSSLKGSTSEIYELGPALKRLKRTLDQRAKNAIVMEKMRAGQWVMD